MTACVRVKETEAETHNSTGKIQSSAALSHQVQTAPSFLEGHGCERPCPGCLFAEMVHGNTPPNVYKPNILYKGTCKYCALYI